MGKFEDISFGASAILVLLVWLAFWGGIAYVIVHFLMKYW